MKSNIQLESGAPRPQTGNPLRGLPAAQLARWATFG